MDAKQAYQRPTTLTFRFPANSQCTYCGTELRSDTWIVRDGVAVCFYGKCTTESEQAVATRISEQESLGHHYEESHGIRFYVPRGMTKDPLKLLHGTIIGNVIHEQTKILGLSSRKQGKGESEQAGFVAREAQESNQGTEQGQENEHNNESHIE